MCAQKPRSGLKTAFSTRVVHPPQPRFAACSKLPAMLASRIHTQNLIQSPYTPFRLTSIQFYPQWFRRPLFCHPPGALSAGTTADRILRISGG